MRALGWAGGLADHRSRRPLNGVVLMVDLVTLLNQKASDRKALVILLRTRLVELSRHLPRGAAALCGVEQVRLA